jgi:hypothetical protein
MLGKITENRRPRRPPSWGPPNVQHKEINKPTKDYYSGQNIRRFANQQLWRNGWWHAPPNAGSRARDAGLIDHHQNVDIVIAQRTGMFLPSGTHAMLNIMTEGVAQESRDFRLELIRIGCLIECLRPSHFLWSSRFLGERKLLQFNGAKRKRVFALLRFDARGQKSHRLCNRSSCVRAFHGKQYTERQPRIESRILREGNVGVRQFTVSPNTSGACRAHPTSEISVALSR